MEEAAAAEVKARLEAEVEARKQSRRSAGLAAMRLLGTLSVMLALFVDGDDVGAVNWWIVCTPFWIMFGSEFLADCVDAWAHMSAAAAIPEADQERAAQLWTTGCASVCHACCAVSFVVVAAVLAVAKLSGASYSSCWVFAPVFVAGGLLCLCMSLVVCCAVDPDAMAQKLATDGNAAYQPVGEDSGGVDTMDGGWSAPTAAARPGGLGVEID
mmetsp:Transcript_33124/g.56671  ORF Transcript_33124/g.56671 Transcript_33124/m.56671 type:complete len:213 (+) Transcript_33124:149-787(+)